jgi:hypothetical protein
VDLKVKVVPGSSRSEIVGAMADGTLKVKVAAPAERGKANAALKTLLAERYGVRERDVEIVSGLKSALKRVRIVQPPAPA